MWNQRVEAAFAPSDCPAAPKVKFDDSYYSGPLIDSHFHMPNLPNGPPREEEAEEGHYTYRKYGDGQGGVMPSLGENVRISDIACTLKQEGTDKVFAFFPVFSDIAGPLLPLLEVVNRTMQQYPTQFVPFIMPPGIVDAVPTVDADALRGMLAAYPGLFQGYGEIGLYEIDGREADDYPPDAPIFLDIYSAVKEHELMVYLHPGEGHEDNLERALQGHPEVSFVTHGEGIEEEIGDLMAKHPNVYFTVNDLYGDQYLLHPGESTETFLAALEDYEPLLEKDLARWKEVIEAHPDQFMWGTDRGGIAVWTFDVEVGQKLVDYARAFIGRLDPEVQEKFAYKNAERLLATVEKTSPAWGSAEYNSRVDPSDLPGGLSLPFRIGDVGGGNEFISPFGIIRHSRDAGHGHGGIDIPLSENAPIYAVADGTIVSTEVSSDGAGGSDVKLLISGSRGEGWGFLYEHVVLEPGVASGSAVTKGQLIGRNGLTTDRRNNHFQLSYVFNEYTFYRDHRCWVDHLDPSSRKLLLDYFNSPETVAMLTAQWESASEEGMNAYKNLLNREGFPTGPQLCYSLGLDVRVSATPTPTATPTGVPSPTPTAVVVTTEPSPTPTTIAEGDMDDCGDAVGNGDEIVFGPSAPEGNDRDSVFRSLTVHPTDPNIVLMGTERNGFVKSTDGAATWTRHRQGLRWLPGIGYPEIYDIA